MTEKPSTRNNLTWHHSKVNAADREPILGQRGCVVWITGLSGSGKSTIAILLEETLIGRGQLAYVLDGDNIRHGLNVDLGFSAEDRQENIRRIGEVAALFANAGIIVIAAFISPYFAGRKGAREAAEDYTFLETYLNVSLEECEKRDPKGLYKRARLGEIPLFTGISDNFDQPKKCDLEIKTWNTPIKKSTKKLINYILSQK